MDSMHCCATNLVSRKSWAMVHGQNCMAGHTRFPEFPPWATSTFPPFSFAEQHEQPGATAGAGASPSNGAGPEGGHMRRLRGPVRAHAQHGETAGGAVSSDGLALAPQTPPSRSGSP